MDDIYCVEVYRDFYIDFGLFGDYYTVCFDGDECIFDGIKAAKQAIDEYYEWINKQ